MQTYCNLAAIKAYNSLNQYELTKSWLNQLKNAQNYLIGEDKDVFLFTHEEAKYIKGICNNLPVYENEQGDKYSLTCHLDECFSNVDLINLYERQQRLLKGSKKIDFLIAKERQQKYQDSSIFWFRSDCHKTTHWNLLKQLDEQQYNDYRIAYEKGHSASDRFNYLPGVADIFTLEKAVVPSLQKNLMNETTLEEADQAQNHNEFIVTSSSKSRMSTGKGFLERFSNRTNKESAFRRHWDLTSQIQELEITHQRYQDYEQCISQLYSGKFDFFWKFEVFLQEMIIREINWLILGKYTQSFLESLGTQKEVKLLKHLHLCDCDSLTDNILESILRNLNQLTELKISHCIQLTNKILKLMSIHPELKIAHLTNLTFNRFNNENKRTLFLKMQYMYLREFQNLEDFDDLTFPQLNKLSIKNCPNLSKLCIDAPQLQRLALNHTPKLQNMIISRTKIDKIAFDNVHNHTVIDIDIIEELKSGVTKHFDALISTASKQRIINSIQFSRRVTYGIPNDQNNILKLIQGLDFLTTINLSHCKLLTDELLLKIFEKNAKELTSIDISCCPNISEKSWYNILKYCSKIEKIALWGNGQFTILDKPLFTDTSKLQILDISYCNWLHCIKIPLNNLHIIMTGCKAFQLDFKYFYIWGQNAFNLISKRDFSQAKQFWRQSLTVLFNHFIRRDDNLSSQDEWERVKISLSETLSTMSQESLSQMYKININEALIQNDFELALTIFDFVLTLPSLEFQHVSKQSLYLPAVEAIRAFCVLWEFLYQKLNSIAKTMYMQRKDSFPAAKTNLSTNVYYSFIQALIFNLTDIVHPEFLKRLKTIPNQKQMKIYLHKEDLLQNNKPEGWSSFDIAVGIQNRKNLIKYALEHAKLIEFRQLLAPEIKHATTITVIYLTMKKAIQIFHKKLLQDNTHNVLTPKQILDFFNGESLSILIDSLQSQTIDDSQTIQNREEFDSSYRYPLPLSLRKKAFVNLVNLYFDANEKMKSTVEVCNNVLGYSVDKRVSLAQLDDFFANHEFIVDHSKAYKIYSAGKSKAFALFEQNLQEFCGSIQTYETYVNDYYENHQTFAFQRYFADHKMTSMVDVAAHMLNSQIVIHADKSEKRKIIYYTAHYGFTKIHIEYDGKGGFARI